MRLVIFLLILLLASGVLAFPAWEGLSVLLFPAGPDVPPYVAGIVLLLLEFGAFGWLLYTCALRFDALQAMNSRALDRGVDLNAIAARFGLALFRDMLCRWLVFFNVLAVLTFLASVLILAINPTDAGALLLLFLAASLLLIVGNALEGLFNFSAARG